jgi:hypothetical protein
MLFVSSGQVQPEGRCNNGWSVELEQGIHEQQHPPLKETEDELKAVTSVTITTSRKW